MSEQIDAVRPAVQIIEVSARDGIQNEAVLLSTDTKLQLIESAVAAGLRRIEAVSFAHPTRVPQMADAEAVLAGLGRRDGVTFTALVLNERGYERAVAAGVEEINMVVTTTETFAEKNQGSTVDGLIEGWDRLARRAHADGVRPTVTISMGFGCPYEGEVPVATVLDVAARVLEAGPTELILADSIGCGVPTDVAERFAALGELAGGGAALRGHFHNTRNTGLANAAAAVAAGVRRLDASLGGVGGCPVAPNATGNIPTEDVAWMLERMGYDTGIDVDALLEVTDWLAAQLGHEVPALLGRARPFPQVARLDR